MDGHCVGFFAGVAEHNGLESAAEQGARSFYIDLIEPSKVYSGSQNILNHKSAWAGAAFESYPDPLH